MKILATLALMLAVGTANAQTINLNPAGGWGALHQYHDVTTDAIPDDPVTIYLPQTGTGNVWLQFDSEGDTSGLGIGDNWHWTGPFASGAPTQLVRYFCTGPLYDAGGYYTQSCTLTGEQMTLTIQETSRRVCTHSGRGQSCHSLWTLLSGVIVK